MRGCDNCGQRLVQEYVAGVLVWQCARPECQPATYTTNQSTAASPPRNPTFITVRT